MKIVFCIYDFRPEKLRLQPWLTVLEVGKALLRRGHSVEVVTDVKIPAEVPEIRTHVVSSLRGTNSREVRGVLESAKPDCVVTTVTPLNLATTAWYGSAAPARWYAFASYPFYQTAEMLRAFPHIERSEFTQYFRHAFVPKALWAHQLRGRYRAVICQSERTAARLSRLVGPGMPIHAIAPGIEKDKWRPATFTEASSGQVTTFLYLGTASRIRGFYVALAAMSKLDGSQVRLRVLARGADPRRAQEIEDEVARYGLSGQVSVIGGWLAQEDIVREIHAASAVLLPFILVPSELPVSVMEIIACGTPVIATDIDGLPSFVGSAGKIVPAGSARALAEAMLEVHENPEVHARWLVGTQEQIAKMESWDSIGERWLRVLSHV